MSQFTIHDQSTAPEGSRQLLTQTEASWGFIPKLHGVLAESPVALEAYDTLFGLVARGSLSPVEQQVVFQTANVFHGCEYCTAGHTFLSRQVGVPEQVISALRESKPIDDARLQALRAFTETVLEDRGVAGDEAVNRFLSAGFTKAQLLEVVIIVATKTISNYTNHLTHMPLEDFMYAEELRWHDPLGRTPRQQAEPA